MDFLTPGIGGNMMPYAQAAGAGGQVQSQEAAKAFSSFFLQNMMKQVFRDQFETGGLFGEENKSSIYSDMFFQQVIEQLSESDAFGLNKFIESAVNRQAVMKETDSYLNGL